MTWEAPKSVLLIVHGICLTWLVASPLAAEDVDPRRPAAIETEEVPVVRAEIFERLAQYQNVRGAAFSGWAPDGSGIPWLDLPSQITFPPAG